MVTRISYDLETYPSVFTIAAEHCDYPLTWGFEISPWRNDSAAIMEWLYWLKANNIELVGFNSLGFDWPVMDLFIKMGGKATAADLYAKAMEIIKGQDGDRFTHTIYPKDRFIPQLDLFKLHHLDNKAKSTGLKALEFNMRMDSIEDLPFPVGTVLTPEQTVVLRKYNAHDVTATKKFYRESLKAIQFREELAIQYNKDFLNFSDVKIGKEIFQMALENRDVQCYEFGPDGRVPRQTLRPVIHLAECIPSYIELHDRSFAYVLQWLKQQSITETKGVFKDVEIQFNGIKFVFGTGGLHAAVDNRTFIADDEWMIADIDVTGMYPAIAIANRFYPEHMGEKFVAVYEELRDERAKHKKGTVMNAILKLAMNGVYGASNEKFSIFFDPKFTMSITLTGQLSISMLAEALVDCVKQLQIIQVNTDGITCYLPRKDKVMFDSVCREWEKITKLQLEEVEYSRIHTRDVNSYIAVKTNGEVKRKGAYEYDVDWHQNASFLVVQKVAEKFFLEGANIRESLRSHTDRMDFMGRVKVPRSSRLVGVYPDGERQLDNTLRYYVSEGGCSLVKVMPPLAKKPNEWRRIGVESGWTVCPCNNIKDAVLPINYAYYEHEVEKLVLGMR